MLTYLYIQLLKKSLQLIKHQNLATLYKDRIITFANNQIISLHNFKRVLLFRKNTDL